MTALENEAFCVENVCLPVNLCGWLCIWIANQPFSSKGHRITKLRHKAGKEKKQPCVAEICGLVPTATATDIRSYGKCLVLQTIMHIDKKRKYLQ